MPFASTLRLARQVRVAQRHDPRLPDDRQRRVRRTARAGLLHGGHDRRGLREGQEPAVRRGRREPAARAARPRSEHGTYPSRGRRQRRNLDLRGPGGVRHAARRGRRARHLSAAHAAAHADQARCGAHQAARSRRGGVRVRCRRHPRGAGGRAPVACRAKARLRGTRACPSGGPGADGAPERGSARSYPLSSQSVGL